MGSLCVQHMAGCTVADRTGSRKKNSMLGRGSRWQWHLGGMGLICGKPAQKVDPTRTSSLSPPRPPTLNLALLTRLCTNQGHDKLPRLTLEIIYNQIWFKHCQLPVSLLRNKGEMFLSVNSIKELYIYNMTQHFLPCFFYFVTILPPFPRVMEYAQQ